MKTMALLLLLVACCFAAPRARAASGSDCTVSTTNVAFGVYDPTSATPLDTQGNIAVDCTGGAVLVTIGLGPGGSGSYANRRMINGSDNLYYDLYLDAGRATRFGDGTAGTSSVACTTGVLSSGNGCTGDNPPGRGRYTEHVIYGRIPASQNVAAGAYSDTVMYIVTF